MNWLLIGVGGALGAISRYFIGLVLTPYSKGFPLPTIVVNSIGAFFFGFAINSGLDDRANSLYIFLTGGFLGAFTTFSTFSFEAVSLIKKGPIFKPFLYIGIHLTIGIAMAFLGFHLL